MFYINAHNRNLKRAILGMCLGVVLDICSGVLDLVRVLYSIKRGRSRKTPKGMTKRYNYARTKKRKDSILLPKSELGFK